MKTTSIAEAQSPLPERTDVAASLPPRGDAAPLFSADAIAACFAALGESAPDRSAVAELFSERR